MKKNTNETTIMLTACAAVITGGEQTETLPGGGFHGGEQTETLPGGGFHGGEQTETLPGGGFHGGEQTETLPGGGFHSECIVGGIRGYGSDKAPPLAANCPPKAIVMWQKGKEISG